MLSRPADGGVLDVSHNALLRFSHGRRLTPGRNPPTVQPRNGSTTKGPRVTWETPEFVEIKMDAEIGSYQDDFGDDPH